MKRVFLTPKIVCPECNGKGEVALTYELASVYNLVKCNMPDGITAPEIYAKLMKGHGFQSPTAANQRLADLEKLKLVHRQRAGKCYLYYAI